eukprot:5926840-Amphidinium_carterae.1
MFWGVCGTVAEWDIRIGWWQLGIFTDDKCTQPVPATTQVHGRYWYDPTVVNGYSQDACVRQSVIARTKHLKIGCDATDDKLK